MKLTKILLFFLIIIFIFVLGFFGGSFYSSKKIDINKQAIYDECWLKANQDLVGLCRPAQELEQNEILNFYGQIIGIDAATKKITVKPAPLENGQDDISQIVIATLNSDIKKIVAKSDSVYQQELADWQNNFNNGINATYPSQYFNQNVGFEAFMMGQKVTVQAKSDVRSGQVIEGENILINL